MFRFGEGKMNRKNLLLLSLLFYYGFANGQNNDSIITVNGEIIKCKIIKIDGEWIFFKRTGRNKPIKIEAVRNIIVDFKIKRSANPDSLLLNFKKRKGALDTIPVSSPKIIHEFFRHAFKINPISFITEYTLKYEYRINHLYAVTIEAGYLHPYPTEELNFISLAKAAPIGFRGWVVRTGASRTISTYGKFRKSIYVTLFFKNEEHEKIRFTDGKESFEYLSRKRKVGGLSILYSTETVVEPFLIQFFAGISIRYIYDDILNYGYQYNIAPSPTFYDPPLAQTKQLFLPAIQGGINIGFGFNGKKKTKE